MAVCGVQCRAAVIYKYRERNFGLADVTKKWTTFFEVLRHVIDVNDRHHELRLKERNIARPFILRDKLFKRFSMEGKGRSLGRSLVQQWPKLLGDIPRHQEIASRDFRSHPRVRNSPRVFVSQ